MQRLTMTSVDQ